MQAEQNPTNTNDLPKEMELGLDAYAGFWRRFFAFVFIDALILTALVGAATELVGLWGGSAVSLSIWWAYYALFESSKYMATPGKMALKIVVTDYSGKKLTIGRATLRFFGKFISSAILLVGYIMAGFTEKKQALHDMVASAIVIKKNALPRN